MSAVDTVEAVEFSVSYGFDEYRQVCFDHMPKEFPGLKLGSIARFFISAGLWIQFTRKKYKMPVCEFRIDSSGIHRRTKLGLLEIAWPQVTAIHRYSTSYLIVKRVGALPIPYRCLDQEQRLRLDTLFETREQNFKDGVQLNDV